MRRAAAFVLLLQTLAVVAAAQDSQEAKGAPTLADLLPVETKQSATEAQGSLSPQAERVVSRAVSRVVRNNQDATKANNAVIVEEKKSLEQELDRVTKAGQLDKALAIRQLLESFEEVVARRAGEDGSSPKPARKDSQMTPVGKWTWPDNGKIGPNQSVFLKADGTATASWHGEAGLWTRGDDGEIRMLVTVGRQVAVFRMTNNGKAMQGTADNVIIHRLQ